MPTSRSSTADAACVVTRRPDPDARHGRSGAGDHRSGRVHRGPHPALVPDPLLLAAAVRGARHAQIRGWMAEEAESAALEAFVRRSPTTTLEAFRAGRSAALDELRRLSHGRSSHRPILVGMAEHGCIEPGYEQVDAAVTLASVLRREVRPRQQRVLAQVADGDTGVEIAADMGVWPSEVSRMVASSVDRVAAALAACR